MMVKSGLEKIFLKFLYAGHYFLLLHKSAQNHKFSNKENGECMEEFQNVTTIFDPCQTFFTRVYRLIQEHQFLLLFIIALMIKIKKFKVLG